MKCGTPPILQLRRIDLSGVVHKCPMIVYHSVVFDLSDIVHECLVVVLYMYLVSVM